MTADEASELAELLDAAIEERERSGEKRLATSNCVGFCPLGAPTWPSFRPNVADAVASLPGLSTADARAFIRAFDRLDRLLPDNPITELALRYRRIALGEEPRPW